MECKIIPTDMRKGIGHNVKWEGGFWGRCGEEGKGRGKMGEICTNRSGESLWKIKSISYDM